MKSMKLILESWRKVQEQVEQEAAPQELAAGSDADTLEKASDELEKLVSSLTQKIEQNQQKQETIKHSGEVLEESLIGMAMIIPAITKIINFLVQKFSKNLTVKGYAELLEKGGHHLEELFLLPFKGVSRLAVRYSGVLKNLPENEKEEAIIKTGDKIAHGLFIITIGAMAYHSGAEAFKAFQGSEYTKAGMEAVAASVKSGEVAPAVGAVISNALKNVANATSTAAGAIVP